jgi:hypothetical protein
MTTRIYCATERSHKVPSLGSVVNDISTRQDMFASHRRVRKLPEYQCTTITRYQYFLH